MNPYNNSSFMYSSYSQYDQKSYQCPVYQNPCPYHHHQINAYQFSSSCYPHNYPSYNSYNYHTFKNSYIHDNQPYSSQEQSTQSSELHDILIKLQNDSGNSKKILQDAIDARKRINTLCDNISKQIEKWNTLDTYKEGETYEEDNLITSLNDEEEESKIKDQDPSHQPPLEPIVEHECNSQFDDGVICRKDGKDMEENNEVYKYDSDYDSDSDSIHDLCYYFKDDFPPNWLDDEYDIDNDVISIDGVNTFNEETKDTSSKNVIPHPIIHETLDIEMEVESDSHNLNAKDDDPDPSIEKDIEEPSIVLSTAHCISKNVTHDESPLPEELNNNHHESYTISIANACHDSPIYDEYNDSYIIPSTHRVLECEIKNNKSMMSDSHGSGDMEITPNLGITEVSIEETPASLPITPHIPYYQAYDGKLTLEDMSYEYHDPFLIKGGTDHSFYIPPLSCMHCPFIKIPKIFSFSFIILKGKNYKNITLNERSLPEKLDYIHWEDNFPTFILVYDLD